MIALVLTRWIPGPDDAQTPDLPSLNGLRAFRDIAPAPQGGDVCIAVEATDQWFDTAEQAGLEVAR